MIRSEDSKFFISCPELIKEERTRVTHEMEEMDVYNIVF